ncbi:helix-turn-helix domain-containing protein [Phycisphaerales bacterium AB-hyl4]|uniref:Helix-turn-helix domain-containing protein n=1 Tax=Natronomicrosphaera hydrolytica TaxID=3242702 RepID=A0ABV4U968_9BACT
MLGEELKHARLAAGLTQEQLAAKAKLTREYVSLLERGQKSPTVDTLLRLCKAMNASAGAMLSRIEATTLTTSSRQRKIQG